VNGDKSLMNLVILQDSVSVPVGNLNVKPVFTHQYINKDLKHFIPSATYLFMEKDKCVKVFSGDINPGSPRPNETTLGMQI